MACPIKELSPSTTYNLIPSNAPGRTMVLLQKVPEACMESLESFRTAKTSSKQLSMVWNGSAGEIRIVCGDEERERRTFSFCTIAESTGKFATTEANKSAEDIVCRSASRHRQLQAIGPVSCKVRVKAVEKEIITHTRTRIIEADNRMRAQSTVVIDTTGPVLSVGGKIKKNGSKKVTHRKPTSAAADSQSGASSSPSNSSFSSGSKTRMVATNSSGGAGAGSSKSKGPASDAADRISPIPSGRGKAPITTSLRSTLIYILAPKSLKLPTIMERLTKINGRLTIDESHLLSTLSSISSKSHDLYQLKTQYLHDLQASSWSHYSSTEQHQLQKRLQSLCDANAGDRSDHNSLNGVSSRNSLQPLAAPIRRSRSPSVAGFVDELGLNSDQSPSSQVTPLPPASRQANHLKQQQQQAPTQQQAHDQQQQQQHSQQHCQPGRSPDCSLLPTSAEKCKLLGNSGRAKLSKSQTSLLAATSKQNQATSRHAIRSKTNHSSSAPPSAASSEVYENAGCKSTLSLRSSRKSHALNGQELGDHTPTKPVKRHREASPSPAREPERKLRRSSSSGGHRIKPDQDVEVDKNWKSKYSEVTSYAIRCAYKNDFNAVYPQYCELNSRMEKVMEEFQVLEEQWKEAEGTPEEDRVRNTVIALHDRYTRDSNFKADREKFQFLHDKLSHIKSLINEYDSLIVAQS